MTVETKEGDGATFIIQLSAR